MTLLQWAFVIAAGIAGYAGVSWLIDRNRAARERRTLGAADSAVKPTVQTPGERSAWDEFKER